MTSTWPLARPVLLRLLELQIPMALGAGVCLVIGGMLRASDDYAVIYHPGTVLYFVGDLFFLTVPVVLWSIGRGWGWRQGLSLAAAMLLPVAAILVVGEIATLDYRSWLVIGMYPAMCLGLLWILMRSSLGTPAHVRNDEP